MWVSLHDEMLADRYFRDPREFSVLIHECRELTRAHTPEFCDSRGTANEAIDLLEALFRIGLERKKEESLST